MTYIDPKEQVRDVILKYPATKAVFERHGLMECGGPYGPKEPISFFARVHEVDLVKLMEDLEAAAAASHQNGRRSTG